MSKKEKSLHEKVKNFFGRRDTTPINFEGMKVDPYVVSSETMKDIGPENNVAHRIKALEGLYEHVTSKKLVDCLYFGSFGDYNWNSLIRRILKTILTNPLRMQYNWRGKAGLSLASKCYQYAVEAIIKHTEDLLRPNQSSETRHIVFQFYVGLINGQLEHMFITRSYLFRLIVRHNVPDDLMPRFDMLKALSRNGRIINYFEEEMGCFLLNWYPEFVAVKKEAEFLPIFTNVIKFNAAYVDEYIISKFVNNVKTLCSDSKKDEDVQESLNLLEAILCYSHLPKDVLHAFVCTLCITVNIEKFVPFSWKQMRNLMGTYAGHKAILHLLLICQDITHHPNPYVVRGAVYFIAMALWGSNRVPTLRHPPTAIMPALSVAVQRNHKLIAYEIILAFNRLVLECGDQLRNRSLVWDSILEIVEKILHYPEFTSTSTPLSALGTALQDFITIAEEHCPEDSHDSLYKIIHQCSDFRSEQSIIQLIQYQEKRLGGYNADFFPVLNEILEKFFKNERRPAIQLEVLNVIQRMRQKSYNFFEEDLVDQAILQYLSHSVAIPDVAVRRGVVELLITMAEIKTSPSFYEIMEIIEKLMKRMLDCPKAGDIDSCSDVVVAVEGLINIFKKKLFDVYSSHCIEVFSLLVQHMQQQYQNLHYEDEVIKIRKMILEFFFQIRANRRKQIGVLSEKMKYCLFVLCGSEDARGLAGPVPNIPLPASPLVPVIISYLSFDLAYQVIISCLKEEKDWTILEMVFRELPSLLRNKALILFGKCSINTLCSTLCNIILDTNSGLPGILKNAPSRLTRTDVNCYIFPCVAALTSYHSNIESYVQRILNRCLQSGLVSRSAKICMEGLTLCLLEMQNSMVKLLPEMLLKLSKISATKVVGVSVLELLSNLIRLPNLYVSFVEDQYMSIFAIALPYTNPFKFNQYTVALAHHVLSMWFLKCRIPFRRDFAKFIAKGLRGNLKIPQDFPKADGDIIVALHTELMETGLDLMARFTFGMCTNVPQRSPISEFLLEKGQKNSWILGNKIVTITTSGCGTKSFKNGLCEQCYTASHEMTKELESANSVLMEPDEKFSVQRKRHRSAIQRTNTTISKEVLSSANLSKDDITLHYNRNRDFDTDCRQHTSFDPDSEKFKSSIESDAESKEKSDKGNHLCSCWCTSWAEVHIRRPTGSTSWMMRIQNQLFLPSAPPEVPLSNLISLVLPQKLETEEHGFGSLPISEFDQLSLIESEKELSCEGGIEITPSQKPNPPMRRTNSSPDMNTGWIQPIEPGTKYPASEGSVELDRDLVELKQTSDEPQELPTKEQEMTEKVKPKHLKLDLSSSNRDRSASVLTGLLTEKQGINSAPVENRLHSNEAQQPSASGSFRDRGHTISVMSPSRPTGADNSAKAPEVSHRSGMSPSFVFLQLFHNNTFGPATQKPVLLQQTEINNRALYLLDFTPPYDTHKIGVVYVGPGQVDDEVAILSNNLGSERYVTFLRGLGSIVDLADIDPKKTYLGGLGTKGEDGQLGLIWHDDVMQVVFHVATFMCNKASDKMRNDKKKHVANDNVMIVYNDSGEDFNTSTIKGQVTHAWIMVQPEDFNCNIVSVKHRSEELIDMFGHTESYIVSDKSLPVFVRQMALHANLASLIINRNMQLKTKFGEVSNWLERLRMIKRLRAKVLDELELKLKKENSDYENSCDTNDYDDFTDYV